MKKIYMIMAALSLLSMSLNAQLLPKAQRSLPINKSLSEFKTDKAPSLMKGNGNTMSKAPLKANLGEGEYILGPYTTDNYSSTGWGLTSITTVSSAAAMMVGVDLNLSEYQDYLGDEIVGYRFATIGDAYIYDVFIYPMSDTYLSSDNLIQWNLYDDEGYPEVFEDSGWHEYRLDTPIEFSFPDSIVGFWLGYEYYQFSSNQSYNKTPVAYNPNSTSHVDRFYWPDNGLYNLQSYIGGDIAIQLIMRHPTSSTEPELTAPANGDNVNVGTNDGMGVSTTINVSGNNLTDDLTVSVSGTGFSVSPTTITAADANDGTTITVTYNGTDPNAQGTLTITSNNGEVETVTVNLTASYAAPTAIVGGLLRLHLLLCDQFKEEIPADNKHPEAYGYILRYEPDQGEAKESAEVEVEIEKTKAKVNGFYTKAEIDGDTNEEAPLLTLSVLNADVEMTLDDENPDILYFMMQGMENAEPTSDDPYLTKLQYINNIHMYEEMEPTSPNVGAHYEPDVVHHYYNSNIIQGSYANGDFLTYAPSVSTWGVQRRYFEDDGKDNTYGAPIWKTAVGAVEIGSKPQMQKQVINANTPQEANNPYTTWTADGKTYCLYFLGANAQGYLPKAAITNINYEPYMFRVFVESPTGKLRKFTRELGEGGGYYAVDAGPVTGKYCVGSFDIESGTWNATDLFFNKAIPSPNALRDGGGQDFDPEAWDGIMKFGAQDGITKDDILVTVRFYYMVEGWDDEAKRDGEARPGNGAESDPGTPDNPGTFIFELVGNGEVVGQTYYNAQGMQSDKPFDGLNIVVTRYSDGTTTTTKVMR